MASFTAAEARAVAESKWPHEPEVFVKVLNAAIAEYVGHGKTWFRPVGYLLHKGYRHPTSRELAILRKHYYERGFVWTPRPDSEQDTLDW